MQLPEEPNSNGSPRPRVLVVDDDKSLCGWLAERLEASGFEVVQRTSAEAALDVLEDHDFDAIVTDLTLAGMTGIELCARCRENRPQMPVIVITGYGDMNSAIGAIRAGASDFITKPVDGAILQHALERALKEGQLKERVRRLKQGEVPPIEAVGQFVGTSRAMQGVYDLIRRVAASQTTVLITGESGTGKELVARALHMLGGRAAGRFVAVNCAAMPSELLESELFGHAKGAFTDAKASRVGLFEQANEGTLMLDEIGEMALDMQPKLLRVLQERAVRPVGGNSTLAMTARIIVATNRDLEEEVEQRRFREDLFYRLNVVPIHVPPLRARGNDIAVLADHFVNKLAARAGRPVPRVSSEAQRTLLGYDWPGNVRELENAIERAIALTSGDEILPSDLPDKIRTFSGTGSRQNDVDLEHTWTLDQLERRHIERALQHHKGNKTLAAKALGVDRRTLYRKLERYDEERTRSGAPPQPES
jgi:two-component system, NtrC family, response regulator AtoC